MATMEDDTDNASIEIDDATVGSTNASDMEEFSDPITDHWAYGVLDARNVTRKPFTIAVKVGILEKFKGYEQSIFT
jgi:hypothetical protein